MAQSRNQQRAEREARQRLEVYNARQEVHARQRSRKVRDNVIAAVGVLVVAAVVTLTQVVYFTSGPGAPAPEASSTPSATATDAAGQNVGDVPDPSLAEGRTWTGDLELNDVKLGVSLDGALAPQAVSSIIQDVQSGYYDGKTCHRLVDDASGAPELIQCGSLNGDGAGDPDYQFGPVENAPADGVYPAGTIAMARGAGEYSMDHQFFIMLADAPLGSDATGYTVVGKVTSGLADLATSDIVTAGITPGSSATDGAPVTPTTITAFSLQ
ncbi:peptidylprolyl isomerase [Galbitalea sp. SE-J8]|uniref:peptidylprolyl isomerase n=1 Tax=Galbitalea sp. SE-J8 TaxID=3054952 RepID=UPI00259CC3F4|nr:peptidylprolyl isomerase [Galbitalea sp. SE-J8]MDM4763245.1 peptidylprolyl isomerase [Galbitalea sp. SE-J8]